MSNCNEQPDTYAVQLINAREVPVWEQATLPTETYIHASIKQYNPQTAADELNRYNIPVQDLLGLKTSADATVPKNGSEIKPVARQQTLHPPTFVCFYFKASAACCDAGRR